MTMESWQSGRTRRSWKPLYRKVSGVRIPYSPPEYKKIPFGIFYILRKSKRTNYLARIGIRKAQAYTSLFLRNFNSEKIRRVCRAGPEKNFRQEIYLWANPLLSAINNKTSRKWCFIIYNDFNKYILKPPIVDNTNFFENKDSGRKITLIISNSNLVLFGNAIYPSFSM